MFILIITYQSDKSQVMTFLSRTVATTETQFTCLISYQKQLNSSNGSLCQRFLGGQRLNHFFQKIEIICIISWRNYFVSFSWLSACSIWREIGLVAGVLAWHGLAGSKSVPQLVIIAHVGTLRAERHTCYEKNYTKLR